MCIYFHHGECTKHAPNNCCKPQIRKQLHFHLEDLFFGLLVSIGVKLRVELSAPTFIPIIFLLVGVIIIEFRFPLTFNIKIK